MTKADIVNEISKNTGIEKITVQKALEAFMETIKDSLVSEKNVYLRGFGSFIVKKRAEKNRGLLTYGDATLGLLAVIKGLTKLINDLPSL